MAKRGHMLPEDVDLDEIEKGLYLGNVSAAVDMNTLKTFKISHILTVDSYPLPHKITSLPGMSFLYIEVDDIRSVDLLSHFQEVVDFIEDGQKNGTVLVHCYFGVSRSAAMVTCFLMKKYKITVDEALESSGDNCHPPQWSYRKELASPFSVSPLRRMTVVTETVWNKNICSARLKMQRRCVGPNAGFMAQLLLYQNMGCHLDNTNQQYKLYMFQAAAASLAKSTNKKVDDRYIAVVQPNPQTSSPPALVAYKCRSCRYPLIGVSALLPHCSGETPEWTDNKWSRSLDDLDICDKGVFTLPIQWMENPEKPIEGKLHCPKCHGKIGSYNWYAGCCCPCQAKVSPAIYFITSKLDKCQ